MDCYIVNISNGDRQMARKYFIAHTANIVFEQVKGGVRAVSPEYRLREQAEEKLAQLRQADDDYAAIVNRNM